MGYFCRFQSFSFLIETEETDLQNLIFILMQLTDLLQQKKMSTPGNIPMFVTCTNLDHYSVQS